MLAMPRRSNVDVRTAYMSDCGRRTIAYNERQRCSTAGTAWTPAGRMKEDPMTNAIVLIDVKSGKANEAARAVAEIRGVREVYSVAGDIDLVAVINADDIDQLTEIIPGGIAKVDGVTRTRTLMAFKTFSSRDEAAAYDLGLD
ncbi:transcriptional regulator, AsnC family protein [Bifidobacterium pullorum]|nr:transcriptional regulator, AsnC family protein [Bifidobacterium pullorum]